MGSRTIRILTSSRCLSLAAAAVAAILVIGVPAAEAATDSGVLYYTTFSPAALKRVSYRLDNGRLELGSPSAVAALRSADGVVFDGSGHLLVGGTQFDTIQQVEPTSGRVTTVPAGGPAFLVTLDPSGGRAWTAGLPGPLSSIPLNPLRPGHQLALSGDQDSITGLAFDAAGGAFYTSSGPEGEGAFGRIDLSTGRTSRLLADLPGSHGIVYDGYSKSLFVFGGQDLFQVNPNSPTTILSSRTIPDVQLDSGTVDGHGHLFLASNYGQLVVIDYSATGRIGDPTAVVSEQHLDSNLDDVAPLSGLGSQTPRSGSAMADVAAGGVAIPVVTGGAWALLRRRRRPTEGRPAWDVRGGRA